MSEEPLLSRLRSDPDTFEWFEALTAAPETHAGSWPHEDAFESFLDIASIPEDDRAILRDLYPVVSGDPDLRWIIDRYTSLLLARLGEPGYEPLPELPQEMGEIRLHLFTFVHATALPATLGYHQARGVSLELSRAILSDIGRHYVIEHDERGRSGLAGGHGWLTLHMRGVIYQFGRLQFEQSLVGNRTSQAIAVGGFPIRKGDPVLSVHIPGYLGGLPPEACDASFAAARTFFVEHFPETPYRFATCHSWLLDPQLASYLPESSNIMQFQRRFHQAHPADPGNEDTLGFIFRSPGTPLEDLPQRTTLERAAVAHIRDGNSWAVGHGWLELANQGA